MNKLKKRIEYNKNSLYDFDKWSLSLFPKLKESSVVMDLGCGNGKQLLKFAKNLSSDDTIFGIDKDNKVLKHIVDIYDGNASLEVCCCDFKDFDFHLTAYENYFDLIYSFYSLYYADDLFKLLKIIRFFLKENSIFWVVLPDIGTNKELFYIIENHYDLPSSVYKSINFFKYDLLLRCKDLGFELVETEILNNKIFFNDINDLMSYLRNTNFYISGFDKQLFNDFKQFFKYGNFEVTKNVVSLKFLNKSKEG